MGPPSVSFRSLFPLNAGSSLAVPISLTTSVGTVREPPLPARKAGLKSLSENSIDVSFQEYPWSVGPPAGMKVAVILSAAKDLQSQSEQTNADSSFRSE